MIQDVLIAVLFLAAMFYIGRMIYKNFTAKSGCTTGCAKCGALDLDKIESELKKRGV